MAKTLEELKADRQNAYQQMEAILAESKEKTGGLLSQEQRDKYDLAEKAYDESHKQVSEWEADLARQQKLAGRMPPVKTQERRTQHDHAGDGKPTEPKKLWGTFGEQLTAIHKAGNPNLGFPLDPRLHQLAATGSSEGVNADGGFMVQSDFSSEILKRMYETGQILQRVRRVPVSANANGLKINAIDETSRVKGSRMGGIQIYRTTEAGQGTSKKPKLRQMQLTLKKLTGMWYATEELLEDASAMEAVARDGFAEEFAFTNEDEVINGTGGAEMLGILNSPALVTVSKETGQAAATIVKANIDKMWSRMFARSMMNAVWLVNQDVFPQLFNLQMPTGTSAAPVWMPAGGISGSPFSTIYGRPVIPVEYCATLGTVGDILFVDLSQYLMIEKGGLQSDQSIHLRFDYGETAFRWIMRNDGQPIWHSALTPAKGSNTLSPYVALATRA